MVPGSLSLHQFLRRISNRRRSYSTLTQTISDPTNKNQIYISQSLDPYLNLSIEHYLFEKSHTDSVILFLYSNQPSIILGRNQNPWNEINFNLLCKKAPNVRIVRRRSGGGTVFHDQGNVNYSVICPTSSFNRDKHAHMVVRALKSVGVKKVGVNERHDIVLGKTEDNQECEIPYKISGSAYKLTKFRSLHHGTCLLSSPYLDTISQYLDAPAKMFIAARGVASVSSRITNVGLSNSTFQKAVVDEFYHTYSTVDPVFVGDELKENFDIAKGYAELKSENWIYCQTPQFTFSIHSDSRYPADSRKTIGEVLELPSSFHQEFTARNGCIRNASSYFSCLLDKNIHEIKDWRLESQMKTSEAMGIRQTRFGIFLNNLFGKAVD